MANGINRVVLLGSLGADPELRVTQSGVAVLNLRLATNESYLDKDKVRRERTDWHSVVVRGRRGEALARYLTKGSSILVEGSLRTSKYQDREGADRYRTEVVASTIVLTGGRRDGGSDSGSPDDSGAGDTYEGG